MNRFLLLRAAYGMLTNAINYVDLNPFEKDWYVDAAHYGPAQSTHDALKILRDARRGVKEEMEQE